MAEKIQPKVATVKHPTIEAIVNEMFRCKTEKEALERLETVKSNFITSRHEPENYDKPAAIIWIKGYDVTSDERKEGYLGNFALVTYKKVKGEDAYTLTATKLEAELSHHPQQKRKKRSMPDWGHPIMRAVRRQRIYNTIETAQAELEQLHNEFPNISIPNPGKLYIMVYSKAHGEDPVQKYILEIKAAAEGGFFIEARENQHKKRELPQAQKQDAPVGAFTSQVMVKQKGRPKKSDNAATGE